MTNPLNKYTNFALKLHQEIQFRKCRIYLRNETINIVNDTTETEIEKLTKLLFTNCDVKHVLRMISRIFGQK